MDKGDDDDDDDGNKYRNCERKTGQQQDLVRFFIKTITISIKVCSLEEEEFAVNANWEN